MEHAGALTGSGDGAGNEAAKAIIERIPVEVLERIAELLPPSTRRQDCLSLIRVCKQW